MATKLSMTKLVEKYCKIPGMSSREELVRKEFKKDLTKYADKFEQDGLGSIAAYKKGTKKNGPVIMLAGHMDEIGLMVSQITKDGFVKFKTVGGWWGHVMLGQLFDIYTSNGKVYTGVVGSKPPHVLPVAERKVVITPDKMYIDLGIKGKDKVEKLGIKPGDMIIPHATFKQMADKDYWIGKAFDNRIAVAAVIEIIRALKGKDHEATFVGVGTVQEEVGLRGAKTSANLVKPDIAFAIDVTIANDVPGLSNGCKLGEGVAISLMDSFTIGHKGLVEYCEKIAKKHKIKFAYDTLIGGGTDAGAIHTSGTGVPTVSLSIPSRYIHSHWSMVHYQDYKACVDLLTKIAMEFKSADLKKILDK